MLEGTTGGLWSSLLFQVGSAVRPDQLAQWFSYLGLESSKGRDCTASLGNLQPCLHVTQADGSG